MKRKALWLTLVALIAGAGAGAFVFRNQIEGAVETRVEAARASRFSKAAFGAWLAASPKDAKSYAAFSAYLRSEMVGDVVPLWQLTRSDASPRPLCPRMAFIIPPKKQWPNIVPVLRLIKAEIIPVLGPLEVRSAFRTPEFNQCINGASQSQHLTFSGIDLIATETEDNRALFEKLCALHRDIGPRTNFGLGAYFDPTKPGRNKDARFHVDTAGYRSWGFSKKAGSSGCKLLAE